MILLDPLARPVIGHRGNRAFAPENTLESFLEAVALGADALEFDLRVSRDGQLVVFHDADAGAHHRRPRPGRRSTAWPNCKRLDAGAHFTRDGGRSFPWRGRGVTVSTFDEIIDALPRSLPCIIELKTPAATEPLRQAVRRHDMAQRIIVAGFDPQATRPLRGAGFALGASTPDVVALLPPALLHLRATPRHVQALCIPQRWHGLPVPIGRAGAHAARQRRRDPCLDRQRAGRGAAAVARRCAGHHQRRPGADAAGARLAQHLPASPLARKARRMNTPTEPAAWPAAAP